MARPTAPSLSGSELHALAKICGKDSDDRRGRLREGGSSESSRTVKAVSSGSNKADRMRWYVTVVRVRAARVKNGKSKIDKGAGSGD